MFFGGPKCQMQLKKGSGREEADVFPSGSWFVVQKAVPSSFLQGNCFVCRCSFDVFQGGGKFFLDHHLGPRKLNMFASHPFFYL